MSAPQTSASSPSSARLRPVPKFDAGELVTPQPIQPMGKLPLLGALVGLAVGVVGVAFFSVSELLVQLAFGSFAGLRQHSAQGLRVGGWFADVAAALPQGHDTYVWALAALPALGGLLLGLWLRLIRDDTGHGLDHAIASFHRQQGQLARGTLLRKFVASCLTLGSGGSAGREGPIGLLGAATGSGVARLFGLSARQRRVLLVAGMAAGIGGMFRAPLAGGLMAAEILYSDAEFEADVLVPAMLASIVSYCVFCLNFGWGSLFSQAAAGYQFTNPLELLPLTILGVVIALGGGAFVGASRLAHGLLKPVPMLLRPALGAGLAGLLAIGLYYGFGLVDQPQRMLFGLMGDGYGALNAALSGQGLWWLFLALALGKVLTCALTLGGGGAGGDFAPSMVIGGCLGAGVGVLFTQVLPAGWLPGAAANPAAVTAVFAVVGMAGFWGGVAKVPISSVIIVSELTGSYHLLLPAMWTCAISYLLARRFKLMQAQVPGRRDSPAHMGDFSVDVLKGMRVADILSDLKQFETVQESTTLREVLEMRSSRQSYFPVVTRTGQFAGVFSLNDVRAVLAQNEVWELLVAADIAHRHVTTVHPRETLAEVARRFAETTYEELPVVADEDEHRLVGIISRRQLNNAYIRRTMQVAGVVAAEDAPAAPPASTP